MHVSGFDRKMGNSVLKRIKVALKPLRRGFPFEAVKLSGTLTQMTVASFKI